MITIGIRELNKYFPDKGFVVDYFDDEQPSELDEWNVLFETFDEVQKYLFDKVKETWKLREEEKP